MAVVLPKRQRDVLEFISQYIQRSGSIPSMRDITRAMGLSSVATIHEHIANLEAKGIIKRSGPRRTQVEITDRHLSERIYSEGSVDLPIMGAIAAGAPLESFVDPSSVLSVSPQMLPKTKRCYALLVKGDSMIEAGILNGDYVIIAQTDVAKDGDIVVGLFDNHFATLKRYYKEATRIRLEPANSTMSPIFVRNLRIQGKVVGLVRKYAN